MCILKLLGGELKNRLISKEGGVSDGSISAYNQVSILFIRCIVEYVYLSCYTGLSAESHIF